MLQVPEDHPLYDALKRIVDMFNRKNSDYALNVDPWSNFRSLAGYFDLHPHEVALFYVMMKADRLKTLRKDDKEPLNEAVSDTYLDMAVYALIMYALFLEWEEYNEGQVDGSR